MNKQTTTAAENTVTYNKYKETWRRFKKNKTALIGLALFCVLLFVIIFANFIAPADAVYYQDYGAMMQRPNSEHWFGTDNYGRDIFARVVHGAKYSLSIALAVTIAATTLGVIVGTLAAYCGGWVDSVLMRVMDVFTSIPGLLLNMVVVAALGASVSSMFIAMTITGVPACARIVRTALLNVIGNEYVEACHAIGTSTFRILSKHVIPNAVGPIIVAATQGVATRILTCATLSFIGLGFQEPIPEWGAMLSMAREYFRGNMYMMVFPGLAIMMSSLSINLIGDGLRDALDPRLRD